MLNPIIHIIVFLTSFCISLSSFAGQKEVPVWRDGGDSAELDDMVVASFRLFAAPAAPVEKNSIHINELVVSYLGSFGDDEQVLSLENLLAMALKKNRLLAVYRQKMAQSQGQLTQARSEYLPHIELQGRYNYSQRESAASAERTETEKDDVLQGTVNFSQLLYDFGKTTGSIEVSKSNVKAADANLQNQIQDIMYKVKVAYYNVLEKRQLINVTAESVRSLEQHLGRAKLYYKAGVRTKIDVINAEVELSNAKMELLRAGYNLKTTRVGLEQILGQKANDGRYTLKSDEVQLDNILEKMLPLPAKLDILIELALTERSDIAQLTRLTEAAAANLQAMRGDYFPSITAEAKYNEYDTDLSLYNDNWEVGVAATWELFSGFHTKGAVAEAQGRLLETKAQLQEQQLLVVREVTESYLQADENRQRVEIALQTLELSKENLFLAEKRYKSGANDVIEFNDAQLGLTKARSEVVTTYYGYLIALADIDRAVGRHL